MPSAPSFQDESDAFVASRLPAYSRKQVRDLQSAMAEAIANLLRAAEFPGPLGKGKIRLQKVFPRWPTSQDRAVLPAACVRSPSPIRNAQALLTPTLLEDTWEPTGKLGIGLYKVSEGECDFQLEVRAPSDAERSALVAGVQGLFFEPMVLNDKGAGAVYGRTVMMPDYWGLPLVLTYQEALVNDDEVSAKTNRWDADFLVRAQAVMVKVGPVSPFTIKVRELVNGQPG